MKTLKLIVTLTVFLLATQGHSQLLKKLKKRAGKAAEEAVIRKTEEKVYDETSKKMDTILGNDGKPDSKNNTKGSKNPPVILSEEGNSKSTPGLEEVGDNEVVFKRGSQILYKDDFSKDAVGDFPAKWNTTLGGEVKKLNGFDMKFLKVPAKSVINLETTKPFPNNFTAELDIIIPEDAPIRMAAIGFAEKVPRHIDYMLTNENDIRVMFHSEGNRDNDALKFGTRNEALGYTYQVVKYSIPVNQKFHLAFEVNGSRIRAFVNGKKMVDLPTAYRSVFSNVLFVSAVTHGNAKSLENYFYVSNVVIAATGEDLRSSVLKDLIEKGNFTTNEIHFASGSDKLQVSSNDILNQIGQAMQLNPSIKFKIIGHTDSDGDSSSNQILSEKRAESVKDYLISNFNIFAKNLVPEGQGESNPIEDNSTPYGKAQNRRVEFVKMQ